MSIIRTIIPLALILGLLFGLAPQPAAAAGLYDDYGLRCHDGACSLSIDLGGDEGKNAGRIAFSTPKQLGVIPAGTSFEIGDTVRVTLPVGDVELLDAELSLSLDEDKRVERARGTARLPFPNLALFDDVQVKNPAVVDVGLDKGANLAALGMPLKPERSYLFFELDSGFSLQADQADQHFQLSVPPGQHATLALDTQEPQVYISGGLNISHNGELTFLRPILDAGVLPLGLDVLPIGQHAAVHLSGSAGKQLDETFLQMGGGFAVDQGVVGEWLGFEATPLAVEGLMSVNKDGLMITGLTRADVQPELLFDGQIRAQAFIPFHDFMDNSFAQLDASAAVPIAKFDGAATARLDGEDVLALAGAVSEQASQWLDAAPSMRPLVAALGDKATQRAAAGYKIVREASENGFGWLTQGSSDAYQSLITRLPVDGVTAE